MFHRIGVPGGALALAVGVSIVLSGCSSATDSVDQALRESASAVASATLALSLHDEQSAPFALTDTALKDALTELGKAESEVTELETAGRTERSQRQTALQDIRDGIDAVSAARASLASGSKSGIDAARDDLEQAEKALSLDGGAK
jgi:hypothetical protein